MALWTGILLLVAFSSLASATLISMRPLTSDIIFLAISLFMLLQFPLGMVCVIDSVIKNIFMSFIACSSHIQLYWVDYLDSIAYCLFFCKRTPAWCLQTNDFALFVLWWWGTSFYVTALSDSYNAIMSCPFKMRTFLGLRTILNPLLRALICLWRKETLLVFSGE